MNLPPEDIHQRLLVARLPSAPQTLMRLMRLCQSDDASAAELAELIASDPGLAAKVLSVAHSAAYHRSGSQTLTLLQATSTLGLALIKVLVISESVFQTFNALRQGGAVDLCAFWKHSLSVAVLTRALAEQQMHPRAEEAYLAGLLHDVGRLALLAAVPEHYTELFLQADEAGLCQQEQDLLGISHAQAGAWLLQRWQVSDALVAAVRHHHDDASELAATQTLAQTLQLAHRLAAVPLNKPFDAAPGVLEQGLDAEEISALIQKAALQVTQIARDLGLAMADTPAAPGQGTNRAQPLDAAQSQLAQELLERSVLNEMAMTLINLCSTNAALTSLRQHASALLQLEDAIVMLARDNQQTLVPVSMNEQHLPTTPLSFDVTLDTPLAHCVAQRKLVFSKRHSPTASILLDVMQSDEVVLLPLLTAQHCLGVLAGAVPPELSQHIRNQLPTLQAFGVYAGLALSRRRLADKNRPTQTITARQAQQLELQRLAQAVDLLVQTLSQATPAAPMTAVDLSLAVRDVVQLLLHRQLIPGNIELRSDLPNRACWVQGSVGMIKQILLILVQDACESMADGGQIVVSGGGLVQRAGGVYTAITVSDTGASRQPALPDASLPAPAGVERDEDNSGLRRVNALLAKMAGQLTFSASPSGRRFDLWLPCARNPSV